MYFVKNVWFPICIEDGEHKAFIDGFWYSIQLMEELKEIEAEKTSHLEWLNQG